MTRKTTFTLLCLLALPLHGSDSRDAEGLDLFNCNDAELVETVETATTEKDLTEFPVEEELFAQDLFSDLGFDANIEDLDTILKNRNFEPRPPSKFIQFLSKGYPLFACVMRCKNRFIATCKRIQLHLTAQMTTLARKISCS